jgi:hypothetical protein
MEFKARVLSDDPRDGGFADSCGTVKNHIAYHAAFDYYPKRFVFSQNMSLPYKVFKAFGTYPFG